MSTEITTIKNTGGELRNLDIVQYSGGEKNGLMVQITQGMGSTLANPHEPGFIKLTRDDAMAVVVELREWINNTR